MEILKVFWNSYLINRHLITGILAKEKELFFSLNANSNLEAIILGEGKFPHPQNLEHIKIPTSFINGSGG